jgi:hypothetical protein
MTPDERAEEIYNHVVTADAAGIMNSTLHMLARQTVQEILGSDHADMEAQIADRLRAALRNSIADATAYLWDDRRFEVQAPGRDTAKSLDEVVTGHIHQGSQTRIRADRRLRARVRRGAHHGK